MGDGNSLGKGEVESSILSCSTRKPNKIKAADRGATKRNQVEPGVNESGWVAGFWQGDLAGYERVVTCGLDEKRWPSPTFLYRYFSECGHLFYLGITGSVRSRHASHAIKFWAYGARFMRVEVFPARWLALTAERSAWESERPTSNRDIPWPPGKCPKEAEWYWRANKNSLVGRSVSWFSVDDWVAPQGIAVPDWWREPFSQSGEIPDHLNYRRMAVVSGWPSRP